jgi:filamentous hemagglutinin
MKFLCHLLDFRKDAVSLHGLKAWKAISAEYAAGTSGTVRVVLEKDLRPGNVWETAELPALKNIPRVERIIAIDPVTKVESEIFNRRKL